MPRHCFANRSGPRTGRFLTRLWRDDSGATAVITGIVMVVLMGFAGLAVEVGLWYGDRRASQTAADAAALGAAYRIYEKGTEADGIVEAGKADAARNDFVNGENGIVLTVSNPPVSGPNIGNEYAAEAVLVKARATMMSSLVMGDSVSIKTRAVAVVPVSGPFCVLALDPSSSSALKFGGAADLTLENCGIIVNSSSSSAMNLVGGSIVGATYADISGNYTKSNNSTLDLEEGAPNIGVDPLPDPFKHLNIPSGSGCDYTSFQSEANNSAWGGAPQPLSPGRYCDGMRIRNKVHLAAGNYIIVGGTFKAVNADAIITSDPGVTIFLTGSGSDYAQVDIAGGATVSITAPTTGTYKGIAFFQDRNAPGGGSPNAFNGGSTMEIQGAIYIPNQEVQFDGGNTSSGGCTKIVAFTIEFTGNSDVDSDCSAFGFDDETRRPPKLME